MIAAERLSPALPGLALSAALALAASLGETMQIMGAGHSWLDGIVLAVLLGVLTRALRPLPPSFEPGIACAATGALELAVALMGAMVSFHIFAGAGLRLLAGTVITVPCAIGAGFVCGRLFGLPARMAMLVACGNAICGNSAIAAVAPAIKADSSEVATAIAFTGALSIAVILILPAAAQGLNLGPFAGGALAGLTVYAVPQVIAAAGPMGPAAIQVATLVKMTRVLMLGPVVTSLCLARRFGERGAQSRHAGFAPADMARFLPPFILGFLALATLRSLGLISPDLAQWTKGLSSVLTLLAMAGLGLSVDLRSLLAAGPRMTCVVCFSWLGLGALSLGMLYLAGIAWR